MDFAKLRSFGLVVCVFAFVCAWGSLETLAQTPAGATALVGAWTLNKGLSDQPQRGAPSDDGGRGDAGSRGGPGGPGGRGGRGGFGGGRGGGGFDGGDVAPDPDAAARLRDAMRDLANPPDHLIIVATDTMIIFTGPDGRTTRLSPDGKKIKDENTKIERKTKWDGDKLVSELSGLVKATETYFVDSERHQLHIVTVMDGARGGSARTFSHVYDLDPR